jgi:hypothetical protein
MQPIPGKTKTNAKTNANVSEPNKREKKVVRLSVRCGIFKGKKFFEKIQK